MTVQVRSGVWALAGVGVWGERRCPGGITGHESGCTACAPERRAHAPAPPAWGMAPRAALSRRVPLPACGEGRGRGEQSRRR